jgi:hypothetical protein
VDADVKLYGLAQARCPLGTELRAASHHVEGSVKRPFGVILVGEWRAKHGQHGIADELLNETVITGNRLGERLEQRVLEFPDLLWVKALGKGSET